MHVLIAGGGFAGLAAALNVANERDASGADVTITQVSRDPWLCIRPRLYEAEPETLRAALPPVLEPAGAGFVEAEVNGIDAANARVTTRTGDALPYDRLVLATGSLLARPPIPGVETAYDIDSWQGAVRFDRRLAELCAAANGAPPAIAILGAGMCGIELACELRARLARHG